MSKVIVTPTVAESLILHRRRLKFNQFRASVKFGVTYDAYREWEKPGSLMGPRQQLGKLRPHEVCYIKRRRKGQTQKEIAKAIGTSRLWVIRMESGQAPVERLRDYWNF